MMQFQTKRVISKRKAIMPKIITSYGIACVKKNGNAYELLMIRKRSTYSFVEFVRGVYDPYKRYDLSYLFDGMTIEEKRVMLSNSFSILWYYAFGTYVSSLTSSEKNRYYKADKKYNTLIGIADGMYLYDLIAKSTNSELLWEIPKGRMNKGETSIMSAVREFEEETNIPKEHYRILFECNSVDYSFIDNGVRYRYVYYPAIIDSKYNVLYDYTNKYMMSEISSIKFLNLETIRVLNNNRLHKISKVIVKKCKKYIK